MPVHAVISPWLNTYQQPLTGDATLLAFPYSGAGSLAYFKWASLYRHGRINFVSVQLPGRENRLHESPISSVPGLVQALLPALSPLLGKPLVLFGHSLGALLAFETCRALQQQGLAMPQHLFVSGFRAPQLANPNRELHRLPTPKFIRALAEYGGTAAAILESREMMDMFMPVLRADFTAHETYRYQPSLPLDCPITAFSGLDDPFATAANMSGWQQQTGRAFEQVCYPGGHFFLNEQMLAINDRLQHSLADALSTG